MNMRNAEKGDYEYDKLFLVFFQNTILSMTDIRLRIGLI
jgi:hypothetical protein